MSNYSEKKLILLHIALAAPFLMVGGVTNVAVASVISYPGPGYQATSNTFLRVDHEDCIYPYPHYYNYSCTIPFHYQGPLAAPQGEYSTTLELGGIPAVATASVNGIPHPNVAVSVDTSGYYPYNPGIGDVGGDAFSELTYYFAVIGPPNSNIPVSLSVTERVGGKTPINPSGLPYDESLTPFAYACAHSQTDTRCVYSTSSIVNGDYVYSGNRAYTIDEVIQSNTFYLFDLIASVESFDGLMFASVDSIISIDPRYSQADGYYLLASMGIGNTVPEPNSLALFGITLVVLAGTSCKSRDKNKMSSKIIQIKKLK
jgi:hypothetical protein